MTVLVHFAPGMPSLGPSVVAIGVFDGVHLGHQKLLDATVRESVRRGIRSVAVTFDRDPDQVIDPEHAAPQLLTLDDKVQFIGQTGIEAVLVVPFTPQIAQLSPEDFLESVLGSAMDVQAIHVGFDFRFGARAEGDVASLEHWAHTHNAVVAPHRLFEVDGEPVTSTRIRDLVAVGECEAARELLGRPPRVAGEVVRGRGEGAGFGVPTANLVPAPFAALPEDGVYAGLAEVEEGVFAAAISVGTPPMFPQAKDYLEAHLIDFEGDLYDQRMTLHFLKRLRSLKRYPSVEDLVAAMRRDIREAADVVDRETAAPPVSNEGVLPDGTPVVDDADALLAAEAAVRGEDLFESAWEVGAQTSWVPIKRADYSVAESRLSCDQQLMRAYAILSDAGIPTGWDPFPPGTEPMLYNIVAKPVSLMVPEEYAEHARELLEEGLDVG